MTSDPKVVLLADQSVGESICRLLIEEYRSDLVLVVTKKSDRISSMAADADIPCIEWSGSAALARELDERFGAGGIDLGILAWWPEIIRPELLAKPRFGFVNTHPSLLPFNRGKHYNFWAIVEEAPFGVTLHMVDAGIDSGDIISQREIKYDWLDTGESLFLAAQREMVRLFRDTYPGMRSGRICRTPQDPGRGSAHHSQELETASFIDLARMYSARNLLNLLRARTFSGKPACKFMDDGRTYEVRVTITEIK